MVGENERVPLFSVKTFACRLRAGRHERQSRDDVLAHAERCDHGAGRVHTVHRQPSKLGELRCERGGEIAGGDHDFTLMHHQATLG